MDAASGPRGQSRWTNRVGVKPLQCNIIMQMKNSFLTHQVTAAPDHLWITPLPDAESEDGELSEMLV